MELNYATKRYVKIRNKSKRLVYLFNNVYFCNQI